MKLIMTATRFAAIGCCVFATACAGTGPTAPTSLSKQIGAGLAATASTAASELPFKGRLQATEAVDQAQHHLVGSGNGTQLGQFAYVADIEVNPDTGDGNGTAVWTAANGDQLLATTNGHVVSFDFPRLGLIETQIIIRGTGRFANASGVIQIERSLDLLTATTTGSFSGLLTLRD